MSEPGCRQGSDVQEGIRANKWMTSERSPLLETYVALDVEVTGEAGREYVMIHVANPCVRWSLSNNQHTTGFTV